MTNLTPPPADALAKIQIKECNNPFKQEQRVIWPTEFDYANGNWEPWMVLVEFEAMLGRLGHNVVLRKIYELPEAR